MAGSIAKCEKCGYLRRGYHRVLPDDWGGTSKLSIKGSTLFRNIFLGELFMEAPKFLGLENWKTAIKGRSEEQQKVIKYFLKPEGCFSKNIPDAEYDSLVQSKYESLNLKQKALDKTGVDESQVNEITPCEFRHWHYDKNTRTKLGKDGKFRSSAYQVTWLLFSDKQIYVYQYTFNMDEDGKKEKTEEYFYKDITNFSTSSESEDTVVLKVGKGCINKKPIPVHEKVDHDVFKLIVPGDSFVCDMVNDSEAEGKIRAMKAKLREKKG
jgi:hypothetical protein